MSNKELYPTFARTKPHDSQISMAVVSLLKTYDWRKLVFVYNDQKEELKETILKVCDEGGKSRIWKAIRTNRGIPAAHGLYDIPVLSTHH